MEHANHHHGRADGSTGAPDVDEGSHVPDAGTRRLFRALESAEVGTFEYDVRSGLLAIDRQGWSLLGADESPPLELTTFVTTVALESADEFIAFFRDVTPTSRRQVFSVLGGDTRNRYVAFAGRAVRVADAWRIAGVMRDHTEAEHARRALRATLHGRSEEIRVRADTTQAMAARLVAELQERRAAEMAGRMCREALTHAARMTGLGFWEEDILSGEVKISPQLQALHGTASQSDLAHLARYGTPLPCIEEDAPLLQHVWEGLCVNREPAEFTYRFRRSDGAIRRLRCVLLPHLNGAGAFVGVVGLVQDLTDVR